MMMAPMSMTPARMTHEMTWPNKLSPTHAMAAPTYPPWEASARGEKSRLRSDPPTPSIGVNKEMNPSKATNMTARPMATRKGRARARNARGT